MIVIMVVTVIVFMPVTMAVVMVMAVMMVVSVPLPRMTVGTPLRLEAGLFARHGEAESAHHLVEDVIGLVTQPAGADLDGDMTVAEVITGPRQAQRIGGARGTDRLGGSPYPYQDAVVTPQQFTVAQAGAVGQHQRRYGPTVQNHALATLLPPLVVQGQRIHRHPDTPMTGDELAHGQNRK